MGKWLHKALESYRIDRALTGTRTATGEVPRTLRPIFRDRDDFSAGHSLTEQTIAALEASQFLVVICSPNAAASPYVNEEVRRFKALGRANRILPIIIDGEPGGIGNECFPQALRVKFDAAGLPSEGLEEPVAADARPAGDGRRIAFLKIVAGLLGVELDEIVQREEKARKRRIRTLTTVALTFLFLVIGATASSVVAYKKLVESEERLNQAIEIAYGFVSEATALSDRFGVPTEVALNLLRRADGALTELLSQGANSEALRFRRALMLDSFSENYERLGQTTEALQRARASNEILLQLANSNGSTPEWKVSLLRSIVRNGVLLASRRERSEALNAYREGLRYAQTFLSADPENTAIAAVAVRMHINIGDVLLSNGGIIEAEKSYIDGLKLIIRLAGGGEDIRDLAAATTKNPYLAYISNEAVDHWTTLQNGQGRFDQALKYRLAILAYTEEAAAKDQQSASAQWNLLNANLKVGESYLDTGAVEQSEAAYRRALVIGQQLAAADPKNIIWRRLIALAADGVGRALLARGNAADALAVFQLNLKEGRPFIEADESNLIWRGLLAVGHERVGDSFLELGQLDHALTEFESARRVSEQLIQRERQSADLRVRIATSYYKIGEALLAKGQFESAAESFDTSVSIWRDQIGADPAVRSVVVYQAYLLRAHARLSHLRGDIAAYRNARQGIGWLASQKMLDAEGRLWFQKQEDANGGPKGLIACLEAPAPDVIVVCTQAIQLAHATRMGLARAFKTRGDAYGAANQTISATSDYDEAIRLWPAFADAHNSRGNVYFREGEYDKSIAAYSEALRHDSQRVVFFSNRANAHANLGSIPAAIEDLGAALKIQPDKGLIVRRGQLLFRNHEPEAALADFSEAMRLDPRFVGAMLDRAIVRGVKGDLEGALADVNAAIDLEPGNAELFNVRAMTYAKTGDVSKAIADLNLAIALNPRLARAWINRGDIYRNERRFDSAISDYSQALRLEPRNAEIYNARGLSLQAVGRIDESIADLDEAIKLDHRFAAAYSNRGLSYATKGDFGRAIVEYDQAIEIDANSAPSRGNRGIALSAVGRFDEAIADFDEAIRIGGPSAAVYDLRGFARVQKGHIEAALVDFGKAVARDPDYANAYSNRGSVYVRMGHFEEALVDLNKAVALRPGVFFARMWRGVALLRLGRGLEAFDDFDEVVRLNPDDASSLTNRGRGHEMLGRYDEAIADHTNAISRNPRLAVAHQNLGRAYEGQGKVSEAARAYQAALAIDSSLDLAREALERLRRSQN
jgi:tetratricopeptide (TPR) repeat protein